MSGNYVDSHVRSRPEGLRGDGQGSTRVSRAPLLWARPAAEPSVQAPGDPLDLRLHQQCEQGAQPVLARCQVIAPGTGISLSIAFLPLSSQQLLSLNSVFKEKRKICPNQAHREKEQSTEGQTSTEQGLGVREWGGVPQVTQPRPPTLLACPRQDHAHTRPLASPAPALATPMPGPCQSPPRPRPAPPSPGARWPAPSAGS